MQSFTDNAGRVWSISVNVGSIKRVRSLCNINILDIVTTDENGKPNSDLLDKLAGDPVALVDVLYAICKPECDAKNISDEEFGTSLSGDAIESATRMLLEEIINFFPEAKRKVFQKVLAATRRFAEESNKKLQALLDSGEFDKELDSQLEKLNGTSVSAPGSAE